MTGGAPDRERPGPEIPSPAEVVGFENIRLGAAFPLLPRLARERAAHAHLAMAPLVRKMTEADARHRDDDDPRQLVAVAELFDRLRATPEWPHLAADERSRLGLLTVRCLRERYELVGDAVLLSRAAEVADAAVAAAEEAAALIGTPDDSRTSLRAMLGTDAPPEATPVIAQLAADARAVAAQVLPTALGTQAAQLTARFGREGDRAGIDRAVAALDRALVLLRGAEQPVPTELRVQYGAALLVRHKGFGDPADADAAVTALRSVVDASSGAAEALDALGCALLSRSEIEGHADDLDEAVAVLEQAVRDHPASPWFRTNLAVALSTRSDATGRLEDARRAVRLHEEALAAVPESAPDRARILDNLLSAQHRPRDGAVSRAADPVRTARALLASTPAGARARPARLGGLAALLLVVAESTADLAALAEAVTLLEDGLAARPADAPDRPGLLARLGRALRVRYCLLGDPADLEAARVHAEEAAATERGGDLHEVALIWSLRSARSGSAEDTRRTTALFGQALDAAGDDVVAVLDIGRHWATWSAENEDWAQAARAAALAVAALDQLDRVPLDPGDRAAILARAEGLAAQSAVAHVRAGDPVGALLAVERRVRLLSEVSEAPPSGGPISLDEILDRARERPLAHLVDDHAGAVVVVVGRDGQVRARSLPDLMAADVSRVAAEAVRELLPDARGGDDGPVIFVDGARRDGLFPERAPAR